MQIVLTILSWFFSFLEFMVLIECVLSWFPPVHGTRFYELIVKFNAPFLEPIRRILQKVMPGGMIDISPIILYMLIIAVQRLLWMVF